MPGKTWPMLFDTSSSGKEMQWEISICPVDDQPAWYIVTRHGQVGGKQQEKKTLIDKGKNLGRANETSARQQAESEAQSKWNKQKDKGYSETRGGSSKKNKPMLAEPYQEFADRVDFSLPAFVQPKLDGRRCIAARNGDVIALMSRGNKPIEFMEHIIEELKLVMPDGSVWDGELYNHELTFQERESLIKRRQPDTEKIQYHIYDVIAPGSFEERYAAFADSFVPLFYSLNLKHLQPVPTHKVKSSDEVWRLHGNFESTGYEGVMLRHGGCPYKEDGRSKQLLKVKKFKDAEFEIVDVIPGDRSPTHGIFVCSMPSPSLARFNVTPEGPHSLKEEYLREREKLIGKLLTVRYFEMTTSDEPVPRFPIGVGIRDEGDL